MIPVTQLISPSKVGRCEHLRFRKLAGATITVRDLQRSIAFYARLFGFRVVARPGNEPFASAIMAGPANARLVIHTCGDNPGCLPLRSRCGFIVSDLDRARETIWDLGISVARDSGEPDHIYRWSNGRTFYIRDPDDNEIELVEERRCCAGTELFAAAVSGWKRELRGPLAEG